jgi:hypothetical protein
MPSDSIATLSRQLGQVMALCDLPAEQLLAHRHGLSGWSPAEHINHMLKVLGAIAGQVLRPKEPPTRKLSLIGKLILLTGYIPRGRGKSPALLRGDKAPLEESRKLIADAQVLLEELRAAPGSPDVLLVRHPLFGGMNRKQALRFAVVHTKHHLKIVNELLGWGGRRRGTE